MFSFKRYRVRSARKVLALLWLAPMTVAFAQGRTPAQRPAAQRPGPKGDGVTLLPNGWRIAPAGRHVFAGDFPLNMVLSPDGRFAIATNNGYTKPSLTVIDLERMQVAQKLPLDHAWLGLAWHADGKRLYAGGAAENTVRELFWAGDKLTMAGAFTLAKPQRNVGFDGLENPGFVGGLGITRDGKTLFAAQIYGKRVTVVETDSGRSVGQMPLPAEPYAVLLSPDEQTVFVSLWGGAKVMLFDRTTFEPRGEIAVGEHPNAMALSRDAARLFVACANTNSVWAIDLESKTAREQISTALYPEAPPGTTPNALAVSPDGKTLLVANADNNTLAVVDIETPGRSKVEGFIPTGWYPTAVLYDQAGTRAFVLSGKGLSSAANPAGPQPVLPRDAWQQYIGTMLQGALSAVDLPDAAGLAKLTERVYSLTPYRDSTRLRPAAKAVDSAIPARVGDASPIEHVFYVIRENRTYDQVLGDMKEGNGDPNLTLFGEDVTPNAHALAREFVLFDNFYVDAEVSYDGHAFSTGAYATDAVEKLWPTRYGNRGGVYLSEGGWEQRNAYGNLAAPKDGYIWDFANRAGISVRSYGEFATWEKKGAPIRASVPGLEGRVHPTYPPYDLTIPDNERVDIFLAELKQFETTGGLPRLSIIRLGNDHTNGTVPGAPTPRAMVAENDLALGRLVAGIAGSRFWKESAIFVIEDDAQNGPDHVDAHRSVLLVASPFARRGIVDSTLYTTSGVLRTMELILGLPPMSQYDAAATPLSAAFARTPREARYQVRSARVSLDEKNRPDAPGAQASLAMNLVEADLAPELELNEIIWKSLRGQDSVMPPPVRTGFIRSVEEEEEEELEGRPPARPR